MTKKQEVRRRCRAHNRHGEQCHRAPIIGGNVCATHGGRSPNAKKGAANRMAEAKARAILETLGQPVKVNPVEALTSLIHWTAGHVEYLRLKVQETSPGDLVWGEAEHRDKTGGEDWGTTTVEKAGANVWLKLYNEERDRLANYCTKAIDAGIAEREIRLAEQQGRLVAEAIRRILGDFLTQLNREYDFGADLEPQWRRWMSEIVPSRLRAIGNPNNN